MTTHEWHERNEDNKQIYYRAKHHSGEWSFQSKVKRDPKWTYYDNGPPIEIVESFREVLWNKIQRRRAPQELILQIDKILEEIRESLAEEDADSETTED